jgi:hypothetical protein
MWSMGLLYLKKLESPPPRKIFANWLKLAGSGEEVKNVKDYRQTDDRQWAIRKAHLSFQLR